MNQTLTVAITEHDTTIEHDFDNRVVDVVVTFGKASDGLLDITVSHDPNGNDWTREELIRALDNASQQVYFGELG